MSEEKSLAARLLKGFAMFWWDFLVGDTPELFIAVVGVLAVIAGIRGAGHNSVAVVVLPVLVIVALTLSVRRAVAQAKKK